jgi:tRNA(Ile)-lysidine synthase
MALLHVLGRLAPRLHFELTAHGVDHGLRAEAAAELDLAARLAAELGVPFERSVRPVAPGGNLQARARALRHAALREAAVRAGAEFIATGHHADDRAETLLIRLLRGSGPRGLSVLPPRSGALIRPLLRARKSDVALHLARHRIEFAEDPSNRNARFLRTRVRLEVLPLLEQLSPTIVEHLCALADALGEGSLPETLCNADGVPLLLNRAQRLELGRARTLKRQGARVMLAGGQEINFEPGTFQPRVRPTDPNPRRSPR